MAVKWINQEDICKYDEINRNELESAMAKCSEQVINNINKTNDKFPGPNSENDFYIFGENVEWTTGFWTGEVWLAYEREPEGSNKSLLLEAAIKQMVSFDERITNMYDVDHHDMGFLYILSCIAGYKLINSKVGYEASLKAADHLMSRYQEKGQFIQAWGTLGAKDNYRLIIDCLLNVPLLYWATEVTGKESYATVAHKHIETTMKYILREDNSTWHTIFFNDETGEFDRGETSQGYSHESAWARGQAWGIYGSALAYKYTKDSQYIEYFIKFSEYFLDHLPEDLCPFWDLSFGIGDEEIEPRDSSAAVIAVCGFLEMSKYLEKADAEKYLSISKKIMKSLVDRYQVKDFSISNGQLLHGTYAKKSPFNNCNPGGVDECVIWGDYFFIEALTRLIEPDWNTYW